MSRRSRRGFWLAAMLIVAVGFFARGRSQTQVVERPESTRPALRPASRRDEKQLHLHVVGVHDSYTITGLDDAKAQHKIRLDAIDAPELGQLFGQAANKALSEKVFGRDVVTGSDRP